MGRHTKLGVLAAVIRVVGEAKGEIRSAISAAEQE
jgi:hypothetical protein